MNDPAIEIVATTISGSISDWRKVERIVPLFEQRGRRNVRLHCVDTHAEARQRTRELVTGGSTTIISAGGSGTFNSVLEGCIDSGAGLSRLTLGFLRKGSADLIGKALGMPDEIEAAVDVFTASLAEGRVVPCDVIAARSDDPRGAPRHFVGYGGAEIFGRIPHYTENRFIKYYKGVLSQLFGDLGPFFVGALLSAIERSVRRAAGKGREWRILVDGREVARGRYQSLIVVNGDLGPDLPYARSAPLGSGEFYLFGLRDLGLFRLPGQFRRAWDASILDRRERLGFESYRVGETLEMRPTGGPFPLNVDGSTMWCAGAAHLQIVDRIRLISDGATGSKPSA